MRFWDSSALVPLLVAQPATDSLGAIRSSDPDLLVWWGSVVECASAIARLKRMDLLEAAGAESARANLERLAASWTEVAPSESIRDSARALLANHELTSGDVVQLAAALQVSAAGERLVDFVCLDQRLRRGAMREGFSVLPDGANRPGA